MKRLRKFPLDPIFLTLISTKGLGPTVVTMILKPLRYYDICSQSY